VYAAWVRIGLSDRSRISNPARSSIGSSSQVKVECFFAHVLGEL
jgi:hypothetical protein